MRPQGVFERARALIDGQYDEVKSRAGNGLRLYLTEFVTVCGRLRYRDLPTVAALENYHDVLVRLDDPTQRRTDTDFESRSLACIELLRPAIEELSGRDIHDVSLEEEDAAYEILRREVPLTLLGEVTTESYFHMVCWNEANSLLEDVMTPYLAARSIANMGYHRPADPYGLLPPITALAERYEDYPSERGDTAAEITALLTRYLDVVPWQGRVSRAG